MKFKASVLPPPATPVESWSLLLSGCVLAVAVLLIRTGGARAAETVYYLGNLGQTDFSHVTLPNDPTYGQVNIACRTGWRYIEPTPNLPYSQWQWGSIDNCRAVAVAAAHGAKYSLSIKIGADTPLWLYASGNPNVAKSCTASTAGLLPTETGPGSGTLNAFQVIWPLPQSTWQPYAQGSTQCIPIPWESDFQTQLNTFIRGVSSHIGSDSLLSHVVVTGINYTTQENIQPNCSTSGCGYGGNTDVTNWVSYIHNNVNSSCHDSASCASIYAGLINGSTGAYNTIIGDWGAAFPTQVRLASMFVDGQSFPFDTTTAFGLNMLDQLAADYPGNPGRALVMNNAAYVKSGSPPTASLANPILCYQGKESSGFPCQSPTQPTASIAFQELKSLIDNNFHCSDLDTLLNTAFSDKSAFMETYPDDVNPCL